MNNFLKKITRLNTEEERSIKGPYILWFSVLLVIGVISSFTDKLPFRSGEAGVVAGSLAAIVLIMLVPMAYINATRLKVRHPRPVLVEPRPLSLVTCWVIAECMLVLALVGSSNLLGISDAELDALFAAETFRSNFVISFIGFTLFCLPFTAYHVWANMWHRQIIEHGAPAWRRHQKKKRASLRN